MQPFDHNFHPPDRLCVHVWEERIFSKNMVIISTWFSRMGLFLITRQAISMQPPALSCVRARICSRVCAQNTPHHHLHSLTSLCFSPSLQPLVKMDKPPACCHMELINRTGGNKRQFNFNTNKETFRIPPNKTPGMSSQDLKPLCVFLKEV